MAPSVAVDWVRYGAALTEIPHLSHHSSWVLRNLLHRVGWNILVVAGVHSPGYCVHAELVWYICCTVPTNYEACSIFCSERLPVL